MSQDTSAPSLASAPGARLVAAFGADLAPDSAEAATLASLSPGRLPRHVAIIMDGNGRWAAQRNKPRVYGHQQGIRSVREAVTSCARLGLEVLTLYAFSRENWKRPAAEVDMLMRLLRRYVREELQTLQDNDIRFRVIGRPADLPAAVRRDLEDAVAATSDNGGMTFNVALSYGSRTEITDAVRGLIEDAVAGRLDGDVTEEVVASRLYTAGQPDPDLVIRTSGENRLSNFLLWQAAYAELWVTDVAWPDFRRAHLFGALADYQRRERRYGGV